MDEAIARVTVAREAGANASFVEAPASLEDLIEIGKRSPWPNVANMIEGGKTPLLPKEQLDQLLDPHAMTLPGGEGSAGG